MQPVQTAVQPESTGIAISFMPKAFFISDAHLGHGEIPEERAKETRLIAFIDQCRNSSDYLFILGDLFDAWAGDDDLGDPFNTGICAALKALSETGTGISSSFQAVWPPTVSAPTVVADL